VVRFLTSQIASQRWLGVQPIAPERVRFDALFHPVKDEQGNDDEADVFPKREL
jgi:hypothetical protein